MRSKFSTNEPFGSYNREHPYNARWIPKFVHWEVLWLLYDRVFDVVWREHPRRKLEVGGFVGGLTFFLANDTNNGLVHQFVGSPREHVLWHDSSTPRTRR